MTLWDLLLKALLDDVEQVGERERERERAVPQDLSNFRDSGRREECPALLALSDQQAGGVPAEVAAAMFEASDIYRLLKTAGRK